MENWGDAEISVIAGVIAIAVVAAFVAWSKSKPGYDRNKDGWLGRIIMGVIVFVIAGVAINGRVEDAWEKKEADRIQRATTVTTRGNRVDADCVRDLMYGDGESYDSAVWQCNEFEERQQYEMDLRDDPRY